MDRESLEKALNYLRHMILIDDSDGEISEAYWLLFEFIQTHAEENDVPALLRKRKGD